MATVVSITNPQYTDINGNPLSAGRVSFLEAGTANYKNVFLDAAHTIVADNPQDLGGDGRHEQGTLYPEEGDYDIVVEGFASGAYFPVYTSEDVTFIPEGQSAIESAVFVSDISTLESLTGTEADLVYVSGYYTPYDGGGGFFRWDDSTTETENGGTVIRPTGTATGAWRRLLNGTVMYPQYFGIIPDDTSRAYDSNLTIMIDWCGANAAYNHIFFPAGEYRVDGSVEFLGDITVEIDDGALFIGQAIASDITFSCSNLIIEHRSAIVSPVAPGCSLTISTSVKEIEAKWFGVDTSFSDNVALLVGAIGTDPLVFREDYDIDDTTTLNFSNQVLVFRDDGELSLTAPSISVNRVQNETDHPVFSGDWGSINWLRPDNTYDMRWFYGSIDTIDSQYADLLTEATSGYADAFFDWTGQTITWGSLYYDHTYVVHRFTDSLMVLTHDAAAVSIVFKRFSTTGRCFSLSVATAVPAVNQPVSPLWFGGLPGVNSDYHSVIETAIRTAVFNNSHVDLDGTNWYIGDPINVLLTDSEIASGKSIVLKNGALVATSALGNRSFFNVKGPVELHEISITAPSAYASAALFTVTGHSSTLYEDRGFKAFKCVFDGQAGRYFEINGQVGLVSFVDCDLKGTTLLNSGVNPVTLIDRCVVEDSGSGNFLFRVGSYTSITNNRFQGTRVYQVGSNGYYTGNIFNESSLELVSPFSISVLSNSFIQSTLQIAPTTAGTVVSGLYIKYNYFRSTSSPEMVILSSTVAATGHKAEVVENICAGTVIHKSTKITGSYDYSFLTLTDDVEDFTINLPTGDYVLPYSTSPVSISGYVSETTVDPGSGDIVNGYVGIVNFHRSSDAGTLPLPAIGGHVEINRAPTLGTRQARIRYTVKVSEVS